MAEAGRILVTGGGIAGLSLAIALRRRLPQPSALTRRLRLERAGWRATRTIPVQIHGLPPCLPFFGLPAGS